MGPGASAGAGILHSLLASHCLYLHEQEQRAASDKINMETLQKPRYYESIARLAMKPSTVSTIARGVAPSLWGAEAASARSVRSQQPVLQETNISVHDMLQDPAMVFYFTQSHDMCPCVCRKMLRNFRQCGLAVAHHTAALVLLQQT